MSTGDGWTNWHDPDLCERADGGNACQCGSRALARDPIPPGDVPVTHLTKPKPTSPFQPLADYLAGLHARKARDE